MASKQERDARLDDLLAKAKSWSDAVETATSARVALLKKMLEGRGVAVASNSAASAVAEMVKQEIDSFLVGG